MAINLNYLKTRVVQYPLLAVVALVAAIATGVRFDLSKSDWSSWVQAVGSIGAIVGTWYATKLQLGHAAKARDADRLASEVANAQIAFDLATDTSRALRSVQRKYETGHQQGRRVVIGDERFVALSVALQNFAARPINPVLFAEVLCQQRELAYTITAINQQNKTALVDFDRAQKATARCAAIHFSQARVEKVLVAAKRAAGETNFLIQTTGGLHDSDW